MSNSTQPGFARRINGLSLCSGAGGLELGLRLALGDDYRTVVFVEREAYAAAGLVARMGDATLEPAPVWDDLTTFDGSPWRGRVDLVSAGFPCQPASNAGKRLGTDDDRWLWPHVGRIVREVRPEWVFLENVPGLLTVNRGRAAEEVFGTLASLGFAAEWDCFSAAQVGAPHLRERLFILAHAGCSGDDSNQPFGIAGSSRAASARAGRSALADAQCGGYPGWASGSGRGSVQRVASAGPGEGLAHPSGGGLRPSERSVRARQPDAEGGRIAVGDAHCDGREGQRPVPELPRSGTPELGSHPDGYDRPLFPPGPADVSAWRDVPPGFEPAVCRMADGLAHRVGGRVVTSRSDQLRVLGNGVVPLVAAYAFLTIRERLTEVH